MPANTPKGFPYPLGTDRVMDGDDAIHNLATAVDTRCGLACSGTGVNVPITVTNTIVSVAITFPVGLFTAAPAITTQQTGAGSAASLANRFCSANSAATTGFSLVGVNTAGPAPFTVSWIAVQTS